MSQNVLLLRGFGLLLDAKLKPITNALSVINTTLNTLQKEVINMEFDLTALRAAVAAAEAAAEAGRAIIVKLVGDLQTLVANSNGQSVDPAAIQGLIDGLNASTTDLTQGTASGVAEDLAINPVVVPAS